MAGRALTEAVLEERFFRHAGRQAVAALRLLGSFGLLCGAMARELFRPPHYFRLVLEQIHFVGIQSLLLVLVTGVATGSVMALQFGYGLARFGASLYVPKLVALAILREMGPVFTSLLVAGRIGSGMTSEIASMKVTQQIDAVRALGTSPIKRIVIPRVAATMIALPILTLFADLVGMVGAMGVCSLELGINAGFFVSKVLETVRMHDLWTGMAKTIFFAFFISVIACWKGLNTEGGTQGVGRSTTWVVVASSIFIMVSDVLLTKLFFLLVYPRP